MPRRQPQKSIGLKAREKEALERAKRLYEERTGERTDWGEFLRVAVTLGLAGLGIYALVKYSRQHPAVLCPRCGAEFAVAYGEDRSLVSYVTCPRCAAEMVVEYGNGETEE